MNGLAVTLQSTDQACPANRVDRLESDRLDADPARLRLAAALVGGTVPAVVAVAAWWLGITFVALVAAFGVPIGAVLAALAAVRAMRPGWVALVVLVALVAPLVGSAVLVMAGTSGDPGQLLVGFLFLTIYAELFGVPVTLPTAFVATLLLRRLGRMPAGRAMRNAAAFAVPAAIAAVATLAVAVGPAAGPAADAGIGPVDWAARSAAVRLEVAIENRTHEPRVVDVMADLGDGSSTGTSLYVEPCTACGAGEPGIARWTHAGDPSGDLGEGVCSPRRLHARIGPVPARAGPGTKVSGGRIAAWRALEGCR
jgi:hypothetical protein